MNRVIAMEILNKRAVRTIKRNFKSYIAIAIISLLSVMLFSGLSTNYNNLKENIYGTMEKSNMADIYVTKKKCSNQEYNDLKDPKYNIKSIEKRLYVDSYIKERKIYIATYNDYSTLNVPAKIVEGEEGVMITKSFAKKRHIDVGEDVEVVLKASIGSIVSIPSEYQSYFEEAKRESMPDLFSQREIKLTMNVTGIINHGEAMGNLVSDVGLLYAQDSAFKMAFVSLINEYYDFTKLDQTKQLAVTAMILAFYGLDISNQYLIKGGNEQAIRKYFSENTESSDLLIITTKELMPGTFSALSDVKQAKGLCFVFPIVFYISALLIIIASIDKTISDDHMALGLMNAIGISRAKIIGYYTGINIFEVLLGAFIGMLLGPAIIPNLLKIKYQKMYSWVDASHRYIYPSCIIMFVVLVLFSFLVTAIKCYTYFKKSPKEVMTSSSVKPHKFFRFEHILPKRAFSIKMALRNIFWNKTKSALVVVGVMGCAALLVCGFGIEDTLNYGLKLEIEEKLDYDIEVSFNHRNINGTEIASRDDRIIYVEEYSYSLVTIEYGDTMLDSIMTIVDDNTKCVNIPISPEGVTLSKKIADEMGVREGDLLGVYYSGELYNINVWKVTSMFFSQGVYVPRSVAPMEYVNNRCMIKCEEDASLDEVCDSITLGDQPSSISDIYYAKTKQDRYNSADKYLSALRKITGLIKIFAVLLCIAVIYNLVSMNFKERVRDMASLKSLGYGYKENAKALTYEITILTAIGGIIGIGLGLPFLKRVLGLNEPPLISFIYRIDFLSYIVALFLTIGISAILNLLISIKIKDIDLVSNLKSKE